MELNQKLPIYNMVVKDGDETGVTFVALVDQPATDFKWQAFRAHEYKFAANQEKRIISGVLMSANMPIYRRDESGEYYVRFDKDTILKIIEKYFKSQNTSNVNMMHDPNRKIDGVHMIESIFVDKSRGVVAPAGYGEITDGSWFGSFKVENDDVWNEFIKTGVFKGFSVEGIFQHAYITDASATALQNLHDKIANLRAEMQTFYTP